MTDHIEDYLVKNRFPVPLDDYLDQVANGKQYDCSTRVKAAIEFGTLNAFRNTGQIQLGLKLHLAYEDAWGRYTRRFPPPAPPQDDD
jgi:hypothetical protein